MAGTSSEVVIGGHRVSTKQKTNSKNNNQLIQYSSANEVESMDDMLIQIFLRVPVLSLLIFKLVSKRWFNLITSRFFIERRREVHNIDPPSGLIIQRRTKCIQYVFAALDTRIQTRYRSLSKDSIPFGSYPDKRDIKILQSCNGLLLCYINRYMLYVYNPFTNRFKMLPQSTCVKPIAGIIGIKMVFDPTKSPHYKVIFVQILREDVPLEVDDVYEDVFVQIRTYSSQTCDWSISHKQLPLRYYSGFIDGVYWNDAIYWLNMKTCLISKLDVNINLTSIPAPIDLREGSLRFHYGLFESRGSLLFSCVCKEPGEFLMVYEMKKGYSEWKMKYFINIYFIIQLIPDDWKLDDGSAKPICIRCIVLEEREEDSFMVMELHGKVAQYKMMLRTLHEISDVGAIHHCIFMERPRLSCFPFIASFAGV